MHLQELQRCRDDLKKAHSQVEKQKAEAAKKEEELKLVTRANEKQEKELKAEIDRLKDQLKNDKEELAKALEKTQQVILTRCIKSHFLHICYCFNQPGLFCLHRVRKLYLLV